MERKKRFIKNIIIIFVFVVGSYFLSGSYLSFERCVNDTLKSMYKHDAEILFKKGNEVYAFNDEHLELYTIYLNKSTPFYKAKDFSEFTYDLRELNFDTHTSYLSHISRLQIIAYRFNPNIEYINVYYEDELVGVLSDWDEYQLAVVEVVEKNPLTYTCVAYDKNNNLIEEKLLY